MKEKICVNCRFITEKSADGTGWCTHQSWITLCDKTCECFEQDLNGWEEITPDNVDEVRNIREDMVIIGWQYNGAMRACTLSYYPFPLDVILKHGGFYYYVLPELKIE